MKDLRDVVIDAITEKMVQNVYDGGNITWLREVIQGGFAGLNKWTDTDLVNEWVKQKEADNE